MEILRLVSQEPESLSPPPTGAAAEMQGPTGVWSAVRYLSKLGKSDVNVIKHHAGWVLQQDPEAALEVFIGAEKRLSPSIVLPILMEHVPQYCAVYLEAMMETGDASAQEFEHTLVDIYIRQALANEAKLGPMHKLPGVLLSNNSVLARILNRSTYYSGLCLAVCSFSLMENILLQV